MDVRVNLKNLTKTIEAIPSKSVAHRKIIATSLSGLDILESNISKDISATGKCMKALIGDEGEFYCGESGSTLRFLLPVAGALGRKGVFVTEGRLSERPIKDLTDELINHGMNINKNEDGNIEVSGKLKSGIYKMRGDVSSQYISGLLFALPLLAGDSEIRTIGKIESESYINLTLKVLEESGIEVKNFHIKGNQRYRLTETSIEGDWSNGAFWLCAGALLENGLTVKGLNLESIQGDKKVIDILRKFGAKVEIFNNEITVRHGDLNGIDIDASDIPDLVPVVSLIASISKGKTRITNVGRLRLKESDRLESTEKTLNSLGADVSIIDEELIINGIGHDLKGNTEHMHGYNDHRIVMTAAVASIVCERPVVISGSEAVNKSYPNFFEDVLKLGGQVEFLEDK
ncbi:MAG: 3-phosphoshikimate 1-carboxyvinyltransferase [Peptostreptococcaceae bacterium]|nr:3-phosphoshikimate 1-carboxyvinyltransferase [Peptostreptococcaceae bacterium]